ncbi:hypothetical protein [Novosphingobium album (ex Liu et al. 2023)]|uniref:Uncharacterized protein n=1 Tax=Novosphingobium album (ex Liu et al. 2023) TaxID=3031130 RepID=A0ABT5WX38_9SPHN|nr:hypothetical protein [Novosphingobium album (ex Liu et al. 2023)]MDE8654462.1 hypothetical protein [Novosphingobium album (ex Liu et al. 2023)]
MSDCASPFDRELGAWPDDADWPDHRVRVTRDWDREPWRLLYDRTRHGSHDGPTYHDDLDNRMIVEITSAGGFDLLVPRHLEAISLFAGFAAALLCTAQQLPPIVAACGGMISACLVGFAGVERVLQRRINYRTHRDDIYG